ncbi:MAG: aldehyde dehydrogenase family protein [Streptosporangiales bacterium]|nr:aldehyde dehydrogenase family protein [Streptosporangiales bacterium]
MTERGLNFIGGAWVPAASGATFERRNPADVDDLVGVFPDSSAADMAAAVAGVAEGCAEWARTTPERRADVLEGAADLLAARAADLTVELVREEGKTLAEASVETGRTPRNLRYFAQLGLGLTGTTYPAAAGGGLVFTAQDPVGVVGAITPWNFPLNIPSRKLGPALATGNGVVFKPSPVTPLLAQRLVEALLEAGLPGGALALVQGGAEPGAALAGDPRAGAITFTGSVPAGHAVHAATGPIRRCQLEMGGKNPVIVAEDADLDVAVGVIAKGAFGLTGQACTGTSRVIVPDALHDALVERLVAAAESRKIGDGRDPGIDMGPLAADFQLEKVLSYVRIGQEEGARLVTGGRRLTGDGRERGFFVEPAVFTECAPDMRLVREEIFGPVLVVQRAGSFEEAAALAHDTPYGLSAGLVTRDLDHALAFARTARAGVVKVNQPTTGMGMTVPFGGLGASGSQTYKEQGGGQLLPFYVQEKSVYVSPHG